MRSVWAPSYAIIFMSHLEEMLNATTIRPFYWKRYIDDVFFVWTESEEEFFQFQDHLNSFHQTIEFTFEASTFP